MKTLTELLKTNFPIMIVLFTILIPNNIQAQTGATTGKRINLGLYGGATTDLTYSLTNFRLFAGVETPSSLFYTDNSCQTWTKAFPDDSLEFDINNQTYGWGGGCRQVLTNSNGWVGAMTTQKGGNLSAAVLSLQNGSFGTFFTVMDNFYLKFDNPNCGPSAVTAIALNDSKFFVAMGNYLYSYNGVQRTLMANLNSISGMPTTPSVNFMAVSNSSSGYPMYLSIASAPLDPGDLYKFDGTTFSKITLQAGRKVQRIYTHPAETTGQTIIISCIDLSSGNLSAYRTVNSASTWSNITPSNMTNFPISDADYSPYWVSSMTTSNGLRIILPGAAYSDDLGATWNSLSLLNNSLATHPSAPNTIIGSSDIGPVISTNGASGPFVHQANYGLEAVSASKIARYSQGNAVYYLATNAGLAYTNAYYNQSVPYDAKWKPPYGLFPIPNIGLNAGVSAVAIDPNDKKHVVAGFINGFSYTTTGPQGFATSQVTGWNDPNGQYDQMITDIKFVTSSVLIATTGSKMNTTFGISTGNIWRSTNGGASWAKVTPTGFQQGNCVAVGISGGQTIIYVGAGHFDFNSSNSVDGALWKSVNSGLTWTKVNNGPSSINGIATKLPIYDIAVKDNTNNVLFIAAGSNLDHAFAYSTNGGSSYTNTSVTGEGEFTSVLQYDNDKFFVASRREIFLYDYSTNQYSLFSRTMPGEFVPDMEKGSLILATNTGVYKIEIEDSTNAGINQTPNSQNKTVSIYPNPSNGSFFIRIPYHSVGKYHITVFNSFGMKVYSSYTDFTIDNHQTIINLKYKPGFYFIILKSENYTFTKKIIIQ